MDPDRPALIGRVALAVPLGFVALFYAVPLAAIVRAGLGSPGTADWGSIWRALWFSSWQATISTVLTLLIGLPGAFVMARVRFPGKALVRGLTTVPFILPTLVTAAAFNALLGPTGWVNRFLQWLFQVGQPPLRFTNTLGAIFVAHVFYNCTIVLRLVGDYWERLHPRIGDAARVLGAGPVRRLLTIHLPLVAPAVGAASLLVFLFTFTSFGVVLVLGGPRFATLEVEVYRQTVAFFDLRSGTVAALVQLVCTGAVGVLYLRLIGSLHRSLPTADPRPEAALREPLRLPTALVLALLVILLVGPLAALAARSVSRGPAVGGSGLTLEYYRSLASQGPAAGFYVSPLAALGNSLGFAAATVILALALGIPVASAIARRRPGDSAGVLDPLLMLPLGTSAVTLGLGFIVALQGPLAPARASPWLVPVVHTLVALPFVIRSLVPALQSVDPTLRLAARTLGAGANQVARYIVAPVVVRAAAVAAVFAFAVSMGEFGATSLISRPEFPTVPMAIYRLLSRPGTINFGQAMALSTILAVTAGTGVVAIERLRLGGVRAF